MDLYKVKCINLGPFYRSDALFRKALNILPDIEKDKLKKTDLKSRFALQKLVEKLASFYALSLLLDEKRLSLKELEVFENEFGKPCSKKIFFNISHSSSHAIAALSDFAEVGVDIEERKKRNIDKYSQKLFSHNETLCYQKLNSDREKLDFFYDSWCAKEAFLKCIGNGITRDLRTLDASNGRAIAVDGDIKSNFILKKIRFRAPVTSFICLRVEK